MFAYTTNIRLANNMRKEEEKYIKLPEAKKCEFTGKLYDAIRIKKCTCCCHEPNKIVMHFAPCCFNGYTEERIYINQAQSV